MFTEPWLAVMDGPVAACAGVSAPAEVSVAAAAATEKAASRQRRNSALLISISPSAASRSRSRGHAVRGRNVLPRTTQRWRSTPCRPVPPADRTVSLTGKNLKSAGRRTIAGMPHSVIEAGGPGRIAVTRDASGAVVVLPLHPGIETDVRGHAFLAASQNVGYDFIRIEKLASMLHGGPGMYLDRFVAGEAQGLLLLHGYGNVFQRRLGVGEKILVEPGGFLYKDAPVTINPVPVQAGAGFRHANWAELTGPGRVGIQSMYVHRHII